MTTISVDPNKMAECCRSAMQEVLPPGVVVIPDDLHPLPAADLAPGDKLTFTYSFTYDP